MSLPRVLLVDDHRMFLEGLCSILSRHFEVVGTATNGEEALNETTITFNPGDGADFRPHPFLPKSTPGF